MRIFSEESYDKMINELNDDAFDFCLDYLYFLWGDKNIERSDIHRNYLAELIYKFSSSRKEFGNEDQDYVNLYFYCLRSYLDSLKCAGGSDAEVYRDRALELLGSLKQKNVDLYDIDDLVCVFIALYKKMGEKIDTMDQPLQCELSGPIDLHLEKEDAGLLIRLYVQENLRPDNFIPKKGWFKNEDKQKEIIYQICNVMYIHNVIFLCRCLQKQGVFSEENK